MSTIRVPGADFDALARGDGAIVGSLRSGQRSKRLVLVHELITTLASSVPLLFETARSKEAFDVLVEAHGHDRAAVDDVILQPHVGAWAMACLRRLSSGGRLPPEDIGHLGGIAAAAALRANRSFEVTIYVRDDTVVLPTFGAAVVAGLDGWCRLRGGPGADAVEIIGSSATHTVPIRGPGGDVTWRPLRRLRATSDSGLTFDAALEDLDPYRGCGHLPVGPRLDDATAAAWQATLDAAWQLLATHEEAQAGAIASGIAAVVPLVSTDAAAELSASCREAVGAVAMTEPTGPLGMALALVHEHQHNKLSALLDLVPLLTPSTGAHHLAPWRPDPRPLHGLIHGTYAFLGLTRFWDSVRRHSQVWDPTAEEGWPHFEFALGRRQVATAVRTLRESGHLTRPGERFVRRMADELTRLSHLDVPSVADEYAELVVADHATAWRLRNCRPDRAWIEGWASSWLSGQDCAWHGDIDVVISDGGRLIASTTRQLLVRHHLAHPGSWQERVDPSDGDVALVIEEDPVGAARLYEAQIERDPGDHASWAGLALAHRGDGTAAGWALTYHPELVYVLHSVVRDPSGRGPGATEIAEWLGSPRV